MSSDDEKLKKKPAAKGAVAKDEDDDDWDDSKKKGGAKKKQPAPAAKKDTKKKNNDDDDAPVAPVVPAAKKGKKKRGDDTDSDADDATNLPVPTKGKSSAATATATATVPAAANNKKAETKKGKKKNAEDSDEEFAKKSSAPVNVVAAEDSDDDKKPAGKKGPAPKKGASSKAAGKNNKDEDADEIPAAAATTTAPKKAPAGKKGGKRRNDDDNEEETKPAEGGDEDDGEFKVAALSTKKANEKAKKALEAQKKQQAAAAAAAAAKSAPAKKAAKKPTNNQFAAALSDEESDSESGSGSDDEKKEVVQSKKAKETAAAASKKKPAKKQESESESEEADDKDDSDDSDDNKKKNSKKAQNQFAFSNDEEDSEEDDDDKEESEDEEEKEERLRKEEAERKRKEEAERKKAEEEEKKRAILEKKKAKKDKKKGEDDEDIAALLAEASQKKAAEEQAKAQKEKEEKEAKKAAAEAKKAAEAAAATATAATAVAGGEGEGEEDNEEEGETGAGGEKKLTKNQLKKMKDKQKKEAGDAAAGTAAAPAAAGGKKGPAVNKAAQAALDKLAKVQQEKIEAERLAAELKRQEEEEKRAIEEAKRKAEEEKELIRLEKIRLKSLGLVKSKAQLKKDEEERIKREQFLKNQNIAVEVVEKKIQESKVVSVVVKEMVVIPPVSSAPIPPAQKKKKIERDAFGQIIVREEKKEEKVVSKVIELDGDDWDACMDDVVTATSADAKSGEGEADATKAEASDKAKQEAAAREAAEELKKKTKKELAEAEKAEKEAKKSAMLEKIHQGQKKKKEEKKPEEKKEILRSPIVCILGHVDTGKTTLLDKLRRTNVQAGEAGGITQQIGATYFPGEAIIAETTKCQDFYPVEVKAPGLLVIDTPGHESFSNLRTRGSSLCDFAILVIDLMHGIEQQTLESIQLLKMRKTPFVIALNKIDRTYTWKTNEFGSSYKSIQDQSRETKNDFDHRFGQIITQLAENSINAALFWDNPDPKTYFPIVPTSGVTGEGIPDLLSVIIKYTALYMKSRMLVKEDAFNCTVMEVKKIDGLGVTIDAILVDGIIRKDDRICLLGFDGPIKTKIRALLTPHPMKEMRVKGEYEHHDIIHASMGIKISAPDLEFAVAGSQLYLANTPEEEETAIDLINSDFSSVKKKVKLQKMGVGVAASTLGSLEALLSFLDASKIPVSYVSVGPVSKDDITKALKSVLADDPAKRRKEYACMLAFDVKILPDAQKYAEDNGVKIFTANIIYHLFDFFVKFVKECEDERKVEEGKNAIFPCILQPIQFFNKADPIIMGVDVVSGCLKPGTPVCVYNATKLKIGVVESIESNKKSIPQARKETGNVAIRIKGSGNLLAGRQFTEKDQLASIISRNSIDMLKEHFKDEVPKDDWLLIRDVLKPFFSII